MRTLGNITSTGPSRARPPEGRWPPATPRRRGGPVDWSDPALVRVAARPRLDSWSDTEPLILAEAAALLCPEGFPITVTTLRTARAAGTLATFRMAGRIYTTPADLRAMSRTEVLPRPPLPARARGLARTRCAEQTTQALDTGTVRATAPTMPAPGADPRPDDERAR